MAIDRPKDEQGLYVIVPVKKDISGKPVLPADRSGFRKERIGSDNSPHLNASAECIMLNVGGSDVDAEGVNAGKTTQGVQSTKATSERRRRHSTLSAGKPRTGGRTPASRKHRAE